MLFIYIYSFPTSPMRRQHSANDRDRAKVEILRIAVNPPVHGETQCVLHQDKFWLVWVYSQLVRLCEHPFLSTILFVIFLMPSANQILCFVPNQIVNRQLKKVRLGRDLKPDFCGVIDRGFRFLMQVSISSKTIPHPGETTRTRLKGAKTLPPPQSYENLPLGTKQGVKCPTHQT